VNSWLQPKVTYRVPPADISFYFVIQNSSLTYGADSFLRNRHLCSYSGTSQHFIEPESSLPCSQEPSTGPYPEPYPTFLVISRNKLNFYGEELLDPHQTPKLVDHTFSAVSDCLFNIFVATLHIWRLSPPSAT
jgi:hypothetical protein